MPISGGAALEIGIAELVLPATAFLGPRSPGRSVQSQPCPVRRDEIRGPRAVLTVLGHPEAVTGPAFVGIAVLWVALSALGGG
ncbi:hypothetical protein [Paractinoplanes atraurantiacus]|uniref:Uncharacterized protein n=1 Tax=Paractinoplanes atraurantiacus TaxID=1036182 RepID=A0A285ICA2_9ACTN|nr:hypothetical protein [Actinoplanes atraurantiacus]SNY44676.1 hypothetical protein SAMN05421748_107104 [Actinoplanes atraurantiacus]